MIGPFELEAGQTTGVICGMLGYLICPIKFRKKFYYISILVRINEIAVLHKALNDTLLSDDQKH